MVTILIFGLLALVLSNSEFCSTSQEPPVAPIYPNSTEHKYGINSDPGHLYWGAGYTSPDSYEEIISFYREQAASCYAITEGTACSGDAEPLGRYIVYINHTADISTNKTEFGIKVDWESCRNVFQLLN
ncbi:MAG: hypothetical protein J0L63_07945 [Anaerolineae bacterium]|nr:hypothetical protein [Anaerolineae bacterium]